MTSKKLLLSGALLATLFLHAEKVVSVEIQTADGARLEAGDVQARCQVKVGDEFEPAQCARDVRALRDANDFENITVKASRTPSGVALVYVVSRKMRFQGPLIVKGCDYWNEGKIAKLAELHDGASYSESDIAAAVARVKNAYRKKNFGEIKVASHIKPLDGLPGVVEITFEIDEGLPTNFKAFSFDGNEAYDEKTLRASFDQLPWWNPMGWFTDTPATEQDLAEAREKLLMHYRNGGFLDVVVSEAKLEANEDDTYNRVFHITEGAQYRVGRIAVTGTKAYASDVVASQIKTLKPGDVAGAKALEDAAHEVEVYCGSGQAALAETRVSVRRVPQANDPHVLNLTFVVEEGHPVTINHVLIRGNDYTQDRVIRREIDMSPGDPMLADKAERSKKRLENLRYFERVHYYLEKPEGAVDEKGKTAVRDLVYELAERNTGNFMIGIGAGTESSIFGQVELSESNFDLFSPWRFRGAGQKGRITVQAGPRVQTYEASVTEPWFLDRQLEFGVTVYRRGRWFDDYDIYRSGVAAEISYPVKFWPTWEAYGRLGFSLAAEIVNFDDVDKGSFYDPKSGDDRPVLKDEEHEYDGNVEVPLEIFWRLDQRDRFMFPTTGHTLKIFGDIVGGDNCYWRVGFNARKYFSVWKKQGHVFMIGLRGETLDDFSDGVPIYDRLFLGGSRSIRGVDFREIAPRYYARENKKGRYVPWGGQTSWCMNMEYSVPVFKMLRLAAFSDLGSVGEDSFDFDTSWFCWSVGVGLRLDLEQFPIRLDFATPIVDPDEDVDEKVFSFSVGYDF